MLLKILRIHGHSMSPVIKENQKVIASSLPYIFRKPRIKDIVVFKINNKVFIKRIDSIEKNKYFVTGDNKNDSIDSRSFGVIERKNILAKLILY